MCVYIDICIERERYRYTSYQCLMAPSASPLPQPSPSRCPSTAASQPLSSSGGVLYGIWYTVNDITWKTT